MLIQFGDYRIIRYDELNYTVQKKRLNKKSGEVEWGRNNRYYPTLKMAALALLEWVHVGDDAETLRDLVKAVDKARAAIVKAVENVVFE